MNDFEALEMEGLGELEDEGSYGEEELEGGDFENFELGESMEADPFLGGLLKTARNVVRSSPMLKGLAVQAAQAAGQALGGQGGAQLARQIAGQVLRETEMEGEFEDESSFEAEFEATGGDPEVLDEAEYFAYMASEASTAGEADPFIGAIANLAGPLISGLLGGNNENGQFQGEGESEASWLGEDEGDQFLPALLPIAAQLLPAAMPLIQKGVQAVGKALTRNPSTRKAVRALPKIAAKTVANLTQQAQRGRPVTRQAVINTLAREATRTLGSKPKLVQALRQNRAAAARAQQRPAMMPVASRPAIPARNGHGGTATLGAVRPGPLGPVQQPGLGGQPFTGSRPRRQIIGYMPVYGFRRSPYR